MPVETIKGGVAEGRLHPPGVTPFWPLLLCAVAAATTFLAYASRMINFFYLTGVYFWDAGWFSYLLSRFEFPPSNPPIIQEAHIPSFFAVHLSPLLPLWGGVFQMISPPAAYAAYQGLFHALLVVVGFGLAGGQFRTPFNAIFRVAFGTVLAFNVITLEAISYPHYELAIPILFIATCYALSQNRLVIACFSFIMMLSAREDAGLHAFCFLGAYVICELINDRRLTRSTRIASGFAFAGLVYSCLAFLFIRIFFPQFNNFAVGYAGSGLFDHLSVAFYAERVYNLFQKRPELIIIFTIPAIVGLLRRDITIAAGTGAILPWIAMSLAAVRAPPGELFTYYAFPLLIVLPWPWLVSALRRLNASEADFRQDIVGGGEALAWCGIVVLSFCAYFAAPFAPNRAVVADARICDMQYLVLKISPSSIRLMVSAKDTIARLITEGELKIWVDDAMLSLLPAVGTVSSRVENAISAPADVNSSKYIVAYFSTYMQTPMIQNSPFALNADTCFYVSGTNLILLTRGTRDMVKSRFRDLVKSQECEHYH